MYAVIRTGGKQYRVQAGDTLQIEKLPGDAGDEVQFEEVLLVADADSVAVGRPLVHGAVVKGKILEHARGEKIIVYKLKHRKDYRRKAGHRQELTTVKINEVVAP